MHPEFLSRIRKYLINMAGSGGPASATNLALRARRRKISYRESSSGSNSDDDRDFEPNPRKRALRSSGKRHHAEEDEDHYELEKEDLTHSLIPSFTTLRSKKPSKPKAKLSSSHANGGTISGHAASKSSQTNSRGRTTKNNDSENCATKYAKFEEFDPLKLGGRIPPWQTLPYEILLQIFQHASYPLLDDVYRPSPSMSSGWLVKVALLCRSFAEPALSTLYYAPPLSTSHAHRLLASLSSQHEKSFLNYRAKIKRLDVEAIGILCRKYDGQEPIELGELLSLTPQVRSVAIYLHRQEVMFRKISGKHKPYQQSLFTTIQTSDIRFSEWTWDGVLIHRSHFPLGSLEVYHSWKQFQNLRFLTFSNFSGLFEMKMLVRSASVLWCLRSLNFHNVTIEGTKDLQMLPKHLESLNFTKCGSLEAQSLAQLLKSHGGELRELALNHNYALDLSFLQDLAIACPKLERLTMDLRFFSTHTTYNDAEPKFEHLMQEMDVPAWPRTLQRIELFHLRKWDTSAANAFFSSLVESAQHLLDLRHVDIKASLGESNWRDRINFRNKWVDRMEKVFKRVPAPPDWRLQSISTFKAHRHEYRRATRTVWRDNMTTEFTKVADSNKFSHVELATPCSNDASGDSDAPLVSKRRSTRLKDRPEDPVETRPIPRKPRKRRRRRRNADEESSSEEDSALEDLDDTQDSPQNLGEDNKNLYIQGMCDIVRVAIDNLRPTEEHLDESNFLDDEISGDDDWNGDDGIYD